MTVQSAKIGIFFDEKNSLKKAEKEEFKKREQVSAKNISSAQIKQYTEQPHAEKNRPQQKMHTPPQGQPFVQRKEKAPEQRPVQPQSQQTPKEVWTNDMIDMATVWLKGMLEQLNRPDVGFTMQPSAYQLNVHFNAAINATPEKDQQLMRSFALLLMQTLRHSLKRPMRGFKIMLIIKNP